MLYYANSCQLFFCCTRCGSFSVFKAVEVNALKCCSNCIHSIHSVSRCSKCNAGHSVPWLLCINNKYINRINCSIFQVSVILSNHVAAYVLYRIKLKIDYTTAPEADYLINCSLLSYTLQPIKCTLTFRFRPWRSSNHSILVYRTQYKKGKGVCKLFMEIHLTTTECHLPYGITQCYLPPDTSERTPPLPQPDRLVLDLPTI